MLHFGAVDYCATVWVNGKSAVGTKAATRPFAPTSPSLLTVDGPQTIVVRAEDDPADLAKPRGKQDWQLEPHSIWYPRTTGIWQTVWMERVPATCIGIRALDAATWSGGRSASKLGSTASGVRICACNVDVCSVGDQLLADDTYTVVAGEVHRRIALSDPGIDDYRNELLWAPARPT